MTLIAAYAGRKYTMVEVSTGSSNSEGRHVCRGRRSTRLAIGERWRDHTLQAASN